MSGTLAVIGDSRGVNRVLEVKPEGKNNLEGLVLEGRITLRRICQEVRCEGMAWIDVAQDKDRWLDL